MRGTTNCAGFVHEKGMKNHAEFAHGERGKNWHLL